MSDKIILPLLILFLLGTGIAALSEPEVIKGTPHPVPAPTSYFDVGSDGSAPGIPVPPLAIPEWAPETFNGAPAILITGHTVYYGDGSYIWISEEGAVYSWTMEEYEI